MRLGQVLFEFGDSKTAEFLLRAYMLEGKEIFENEEDENETETAVLKKPMNLAIGINQNETKMTGGRDIPFLNFLEPHKSPHI